MQPNLLCSVQKPHVTVNCTGESEVTFTCSVSQVRKIYLYIYIYQNVFSMLALILGGLKV